MPARASFEARLGIGSQQLPLGEEKIPLYNFEVSFDPHKTLDPEHMHNGNIRNTWDVKFNYSIQEPRAEAGLETMTVQGKSAFEEIMWPVLKSEPEERATAEPLMQSEWIRGWGLPALEQSLKITRPEVEDKEGGT